MESEPRRAVLLDLDAFTQEHKGCGDLTAAVEPDWTVWIACTCGARIVRSGDD